MLITTQGIALSLDQYNAFLTALPLLESVLSKRDVQVVRPDYKAELNAAEPDYEPEKELQVGPPIDEDEDHDEQ